MGRIFVAIYIFIKRHRFAMLAALVAFVVFAAINIRNITFFDDFSAVFPQSDEIEIYNEVISSSTIIEQIVFNVYQKDALQEADPDMLTSVASQLSDSIRYYLKPEFVRSITSGTDEHFFFDVFDLFYNHIPFFLDSADYLMLDTMLTYDGIKSRMEANLRSLMSPVSFVTRDFLLYDPLDIVFPKLGILKDIQLEQGMVLYNNFLVTEDNRNVLFFVLPSDSRGTAQNEYFIRELERITGDFEQVYPEIKIGYYGSVPVAIANTRQIKKDIMLTVSIALVLLFFLMFFFFRRFRNILLIFVPAAAGGIIALFLFSVFKPEISALSLAIGSVLLGITVDFSLHFLTHNKHSGSSKLTLKAITEPVFISGFTTTIAFLCLLIITSPALRDLGVFASVAVMGAAIGAMIILPQLAKAQKASKEKRYRHTIVEKIAAFEHHKVKPLILAVFVISIFLLYFTRYTGFEEDLEKSGYLTEELAEADKRLKQISDITETTVYVMAEAETLDECLDINREIVNELQSLQNKNVLGSYYSVSRIIPSVKMQDEKISMWNSFWTDQRINESKHLMRKAGGLLGFNEKAYSGFFQMIERDYETVSPDSIAQKLGLISENFIIHTPKRVMVANMIKADTDEVSEAISANLAGKQNTLVFDKKTLAESLFTILKKDFNRFVLISLTAVFLIILMFFGRIELAIITFLPMALSWGWTMGIMGLFDVKFNIFNIVISAFIFGLGIDYSIFITKGMLQKYKLNSDNIISYKSSILLSCLSTIIGVGVLIFAKHPALKSIALLSIIGISSVVVIAFILQPFLFNLVFYSKGKKRKNPINLYKLIVSSSGFFYFGLAAIFISFIVVFFKILPVKKARKKLWFKKMISAACKVIIFSSWFYVDKRAFEINKKTFDKPSIVISNHQSVMDLLLFMSISPKIVMLVKDWVWKNFFFGQIVRYAGFVNVEKDYKETMAALQKSLDEGNSILVFPEGSRTRTGKIRRFHKGAFYYAEQLKADITAVLLHGFFDMLPPGTFLIDPYPVNVKLLGRFSYDELGDDYSARAKAMCKLYRSKYEKLIKTERKTSFFKKELIDKYKFKGPIIEYYVRIKLRLENNYELFDELIPDNAKIFDAGCGFGMVSNMLSLTAKDRYVKGVDYDDEKIVIAKNSIAVGQQNIFFECADIVEYEPGLYDVFILFDVLHYIPASLQVALINKFISKLNLDGMIIIREGNKDIRKKHFMTRVSEFFSVGLGFNKAKDKLSFISGSLLEQIAKDNEMSIEVIDCRTRTSNQVFVMKKGS